MAQVSMIQRPAYHAEDDRVRFEMCSFGTVLASSLMRWKDGKGKTSVAVVTRQINTGSNAIAPELCPETIEGNTPQRGSYLAPWMMETCCDLPDSKHQPPRPFCIC